MGLFSRKPPELPDAARALPGRDTPIATAERHLVSGRPLHGPYPAGSEIAYFALGCYWGAERLFWQIPGVWVTAVGNMGGFTPNPTYEEVCSGMTGHAETVMVVYEPAGGVLRRASQGVLGGPRPDAGHAPGQRRGHAIPLGDLLDQRGPARRGTGLARRLSGGARRPGPWPITTEIAPAGPFYFAEAYHQQYLARNPFGYCGLAGTGVACPVGTAAAAG
jgi:peptide-methionine (S)-S-oxide reductase